VKSYVFCSGRLEGGVVVTDPEVARRILDVIPTAARAPSTRATSVISESGFA